MTLEWWMAAMACTCGLAASPLLVGMGRTDTVYPTWLNVLVGTALVVLAWLAPVGTSGAMPALIALGVVGMMPIVVDGLLDRAGTGDMPGGATGGSGGDVGDATMATSASLAATTALCGTL